jgi:hypothetical protein
LRFRFILRFGLVFVDKGVAVDAGCFAAWDCGGFGFAEMWSAGDGVFDCGYGG